MGNLHGYCYGFVDTSLRWDRLIEAKTENSTGATITMVAMVATMLDDLFATTLVERSVVKLLSKWDQE